MSKIDIKNKKSKVIAISLVLLLIVSLINTNFNFAYAQSEEGPTVKLVAEEEPFEVSQIGYFDGSPCFYTYFDKAPNEILMDFDSSSQVIYNSAENDDPSSEAAYLIDPDDYFGEGVKNPDKVQSGWATVELKYFAETEIPKVSLTNNGTLDEKGDYYFIWICKGENYEITLLLIQVGGEKYGAPVVDKTMLSSTITTAKALQDSSYYTSDDRYNGKATSKSGFWTDFQSALTTANSVKDNEAATQKQVDAAVDALQSAMKNLISTANVNPTKLYEAIQAAKYDQKDSADYTESTWQVFDSAYQAASDELAKLYDTDGLPTFYNTTQDGLQDSIDALADKLTAAEAALETVSQSNNYQRLFNLGRTYLQPMIQIAKGVDQSDYTEESSTALQKAITEAEQIYEEKTKLPAVMAEKLKAIKAYQDAYEKLFKAYYYNLESKGDIEIKLTATDPVAARAGKESGVSGYVGKVQLSESYTLRAALTAAGITPGTSDDPKVYINGVYVSEKYVTDGVDSETDSLLDNLKLHHGDEVVVAWNYRPESLQSPTIAEGVQAYLSQYAESLKTAAFREGDSITVEAGENFTLHVNEKAAYLGANSQATSPAGGMQLYVSKNGSDTDNLNDLNMLKDGSKAVTTDESGKAELALYAPGWYVVSAYDLTEDIKGDWPQWPRDQLPSSGVYASVNSGAVIRVHVTESKDVAQVKKNLQSELKQAYQDYPESYFSEDNWKAIQSAYDTAKAAIDSAADTGAARLAQQNGIAQIQMIQATTTADNEAKLNTLRSSLDQLPDDAALLDQSMETLVNEFVSAYEALSDYQKKLLSSVETEKCEAIYAAATAEEGLPEAKSYTLKVKAVTEDSADQSALNAMIQYLQDQHSVKTPLSSGADIDSEDYKTGANSYNLCQYAVNGDMNAVDANGLAYVTLPLDVGYFSYPSIREPGELTGDNWKITDENFQITKLDYLNNLVTRNFTVTLNGSEYEVKSITYDGIDKSNVKMNSGSFIDKTGYKGKDPNVVNVRFSEAMAYFQMPFNDVTVTVTWGKVDLDSQKTTAIQAIEKAYDGYPLTEYDEDGQAALLQAKNNGIDSVNAANTEDGIAAARKAALAAMAAVAKKGSNDEADMGSAVGKVRVSVENTTFSGAPAGLTGRFFDTNVTLYEKDTMMTCILRALKENGYSWTGTGGATANGKDDPTITYIASIARGDQELAQFDGGSQSGWMGTLNDFFTNEGFQSFGVDKTGFYKLENGDEISIMYTSKGLGEDIGGSWGNSDTSLKGLALSGGTLSPAFDGKTLTYTLVIPGDTANVVVTPTAANKNYMVRTYLNSYKKESAFYKRSESIPVKNGDVIYVGVGEAEWPSMNKQGAEARDYSPTKYTIKVVKAGADSVNEAIKALPAEGKITYANYKNYVSAVTSAKELYDALSSEDKKDVSADDTAKLNAAVQKIQFYSDIDNVKALLAALPNSDRVSDSQLSSYKSQINAATAAYSKLNDEQKKYITINDVNNYNKLAERLGMTSITGSEEMPESEVATANGTTTAPTQVTVSEGTATATVKADTMAEVLKQAVEGKSKVIELQVADSDVKDATKVAVELSKASVSDITAKTDASLSVKTPFGSVGLDQAAMKEAVKAASGSDLTIVLEKQTVSDADQNLLGGGAAQTKVSILSGGKEITDLGSGKVKISLPVTSDLKDKDLAAVYTDSEGKLVKVSGKLVTIDGKQYYQIETSRPETFVLAEAAKVDAAIKAQGGETDEEKLERIKAGVEGTTIQLRSKLNKRSIKLTWTKSKGYKVDGYQLYRSTKKSSGYKKYVTTKKLTYTNKAKLKKGTRYYYKVRGYRVIDGKTYYTQWSNKAYRLMKANSVDYGVKKTTVKAKAAASKGAVKVSWTKSKGYKVDGYQVYRSTSKTKNFKKLGTTAKKTFKNTKSLKKGKTYYYKVRGYRVLDGKKVYTKWSTTISVKAQ